MHSHCIPSRGIDHYILWYYLICSIGFVVHSPGFWHVVNHWLCMLLVAWCYSWHARKRWFTPPSTWSSHTHVQLGWAPNSQRGNYYLCCMRAKTTAAVRSGALVTTDTVLATLVRSYPPMLPRFSQRNVLRLLAQRLDLLSLLDC